jgi:glycosyltransferase involved in cell wall biosynthesis
MTPEPPVVPGLNGQESVVSVATILENNSEVIADFLREASEILAKTQRYFELLVVDNHSMDGGEVRVQALMRDLPNIRLIRLSRVHAREIAFSAGLDHCIGDYIITLDLGQDPAHLIGEILQRIMAGADVVVGQRRPQPRPWLNQTLSAVSRKLASYALQTQLDSSANYCFGFSRRALNSLTRIRSKGRFIAYDSRFVGYRRVVLDYEPQLRRNGTRRKESLLDAAAGPMQMTVAHSLLPLRFATLLGLAASILNLLYLGYILVVILVKNKIAEGWLTTSLSHTVMFMFLFLILAILSEYIGQILRESKDQPSYFVEQETVSPSSCFDRNRLNIV